MSIPSSRILLLLLLITSVSPAPARAFDDARDAEASKAKSIIKNVRKKIEKIEEGLENPKVLGKPDWFGKQIDGIRKMIEKIPGKDPGWDIAVENSFLSKFEAKVRVATKAHADSSYREGFDKLVGEIKEAMAEDRKLSSPATFERSYKSLDRYFEKIAKSEPERDFSQEKDELEALKIEVEKAIAAYNQRVVEESEPEIVVVSPLPGLESAAAMAPDWCEGSAYSPGRVHGSEYVNLASNLDLRSLQKAAALACEQPDFDKRRQWSASWRQAVINATGLPDAKVRDLYRLVLKGDDAVDQLKTASCSRYEAPRRGSAAMPGAPTPDPAETILGEAFAAGLGCKSSPLTMTSGDLYFSGLEWWMDRSAQPPSELTRAVFVLSQIGSSLPESERREGKTWAANAAKNLGAFAFAGSDARRLDLAKFQQELGTHNLNEYGKLMAEVTFRRAKLLGTLFEKAYGALSPELKELVTTVPERGFREWEALAKKYQPGLANMLEIEKKFLDGRPAPLKGQFDKTFGFFRDFLRAEVKAQNPADIQALEDIAFGPIGHSLASATLVAAAYDGQFVYAAQLYQRMDRHRGWRGPRWAAYWATMDRYSELKAENPNLAVEQNQIARWLNTPEPNWLSKAYERTYNNTSGQEGGALVESVAREGSLTKVTFVTREWEQATYDCVETNKIDRITSDGQILYRKLCTYKGTEKRSSTEKPILILSQLAGGIAAGNLVEDFVEFTQERKAVPILVWTNPEKKTLTNFMGIALR